MKTIIGPLGLVVLATVATLVGCSSSPAGDPSGGESDLSGSTTGNVGYYSGGDGDGAYDLGYAGDEPNEDESGQGGAGGAPNDHIEAVGTNPFVEVDHDPLSTFAADV